MKNIIFITIIVALAACKTVNTPKKKITPAEEQRIEYIKLVGPHQPLIAEPKREEKNVQ